MTLPKIIALCGNPKSGKSTAAELLSEIYGYEIVDDGLPLREIGMNYLGLTPDQVFTQEGKLESVEINGRTWEVREILGEIGNAFEEKFGGDVIPLMSMNRMIADKKYVLGSVRRDQGHFWAKQGAMVIEIENPDAPISKYEFDRYSKTAVQKTVLNDGLSKGMSEDDALLRFAGQLSEVIEN